MIPQHTIQPTTFAKCELRAINVSKGGIEIARHVRLAGSSDERRRGLRGQACLAPGDGLYITPCEWVHTFGMKFPIDIVFLSSTGRVLSVHHSLKPRRISKLVFRARGALELLAGTLRVSGTSVGDTVQFLNTKSGTVQPL